MSTFYTERNMYLRAAEGDEDAERELLAHLRRKVAKRHVRLGEAGDRQLNLDACGELVLQAARGDRRARSRLIEIITECDPSRVATARMEPGAAGTRGGYHRLDLELPGLNIGVAAAPNDPLDAARPLRVVVFEDG
jgi:hypothetical protein